MKRIGIIGLLLLACYVAVLFFRVGQAEKIKGVWNLYNEGYHDFEYESMMFFEGGKVELIDGFFFKEDGQYTLRNGEIEISLSDRRLLKFQIDKIDNSSLTFTNKMVFKKAKTQELESIESYSLLGICSGTFLDKSTGFEVLHLYIGGNENLVIRRGGGIITINDIPHVFYTHNLRKFPLLLFVGKKVSLKELWQIHTKLKPRFPDPILLVLNKSGEKGYCIFSEPIETWKEDILSYLKDDNQPPLPLEKMNRYSSESTYLKMNPIRIEINSKADFSSIQNLISGQKYLVLVNSNLSVKDYMKLKIKLNSIQDSLQTEIKTKIF